MSAWVEIPCLLALRDEFDRVSPGRDRGADGTIGDSSHTSSSDHTPDEDSDVLRDHDADNKNEVHALDIDCTGPWPDGRGGGAGDWFDRKIGDIVAREKTEYESPDIFGRLQYVIWRGRIISRSWGWSAWHPYTGPSAHFDHAHFSGRYLSNTEADTRSWGVYEEAVVARNITDEDIAAIWNFQVVNPYLTAPNNMQPIQTPIRYAPSKTPHETTWAKVDALAATLNAFIASEAADDATKAQALQNLAAALDTLAPAVADAVIAALPDTGDPISQDEVTIAVKAAFHDAFALS